MPKYTLRTPNARRSIPAGTKLHIAPQPTPGLAIGYRKSETLGGVWFARKHREGTTKYDFHRIGAADDSNEANNRTFFSYEQAVKIGEEWHQHETGVTVVKKNYTVADLASEYLHDRKMNLSKSLHKMEVSINTHILSQLGNISVRKLTHGDLRKWFDNLSSGGRSNSTCNRLLSTFKAILNYGYRQHKISNNSAWARIQSKTVIRNPEIVVLTKGEAKALMRNCSPDFLPLVQAALLTGCRYGELCALQVKHFLSSTEQIHIAQSKNGYARNVPLNEYGIALFQQFTQGRQPEETIFLKDGKREWRGSEQAPPINAAVKAARISKHITFHCLRHTYASWCLQNGMRMEQVSKLLGHRDIRITQKHYADFSHSHMQDTVRAYAPQIALETACGDPAPLTLPEAEEIAVSV